MKLNNFILPVILAVVSAFAIAENPYAGQQNRELKSLSSKEIEGYLGGKGMGFAKVAELNSYPGPRHVLELSKALQLTNQQIAKTNEIYNEMHKRVTQLGRSFIELEREVESEFAMGAATPDKTRTLLLKSSQVAGEIRFHHINAHLKQRDVLTTEQIDLYNRLRGYGDHDHQGQHHH